MFPSFARLSLSIESVPESSEGADFVTEDGHVLVSLRRRPEGRMALVGVWRYGVVQMSVPLGGSYGNARVEYGGQTGLCTTPEGISCTRLFLRSAHNRGHATVLIRNGYMIGQFS